MGIVHSQHQTINPCRDVHSSGTTVTKRYPFLISVPHGGIKVPPEVSGLCNLEVKELTHYSDPGTRHLFDFHDRIAAFIDTPVSRMIVDLNRPPYPLPPRDPDGLIKRQTVDGSHVYLPDRYPDIRLIHTLLVRYYFPYHAEVDRLLDTHAVQIAFDCHSMLPIGPLTQKDAGKERPLICLGNNGDRRGRPRRKGLVTCPPEWVISLSREFREVFSLDHEVAINDPFSGGFIINSHYWHKGIPWVQIEVNRSLYEEGESRGNGIIKERMSDVREKIWRTLTGFWERKE